LLLSNHIGSGPLTGTVDLKSPDLRSPCPPLRTSGLLFVWNLE